MYARFHGIGVVALAVTGLCASSLFGITVYETTFDSLTPGHTAPSPGLAGQDDWYSSAAQPPSFGEIQDVIANTGQALRETTDPSYSFDMMTVDTRPVAPPDLALTPLITLRFDFYAHSSDYDNINIYAARLSLTGGPHPGFELIVVSLTGGNGVSKRDTGVNVLLYAFNGVDNNDYIPLAVGQGLSWDSWHSLTLVLDQTLDRYVSLTVDGVAEDLSAYTLTRNIVDPIGWQRGQLIENINAIMTAGRDLDPLATTDDIYWDNLSVEVAVPEPVCLLLLLMAGSGLPLRRGRRRPGA